ncbi:MAG: LysR family transcriptional regulator [Burkholderiales bacterium]
MTPEAFGGAKISHDRGMRPLHCRHRVNAMEALTMIELRRLVHLVALADERHFARAADRVHLSQPAFSRSIQALERDLDQRLFDREVGDVRPTPAGTFLIERARRLLFEARCFERDATLYGNAELGDIAFGAGPFPAATLMPKVLPELRRRHPEVGLRLEVSNWRVLLDHLCAEDIEFFIADVRALPPDVALDVRSLGRQPGGFYARAGHPLAGRSCTVAELWRHGVASTRLPPSVTTALAALLGLPALQKPHFALECDDVVLLQSVALATDTVLALTDAAARDLMRQKKLLALRVSNLPRLFVEMGIVSLTHRSPSPMAQRVIELVSAVARDVNV